jgi:hypothetical protein
MANPSRVLQPQRVRLAMSKDDSRWRKMEFTQDDVVVLRVRPIDIGGAHFRIRRRRIDHVRARRVPGEAAEEQDTGDDGMAEDVHAVNLAAVVKDGVEGRA